MGLIDRDAQEIDQKSADRARSVVKKRVLVVTDSTGKAFNDQTRSEKMRRNSLVEFRTQNMPNEIGSSTFDQ